MFKNTVQVIVFAVFLIILGSCPLYGTQSYSLLPLDLDKSPTTEELMAAGQLGGLLYPTTGNSEKSDEKASLAFAKTIQKWNKHDYKNAVKDFRKFLEKYPDNEWASEAVLHIGCDARYNGRYSEAREIFTTLKDKHKDKEDTGSQRLYSKATLRLGVLDFLQNSWDESATQFTLLKEQSSSWRDRTYASHWLQKLSSLKKQHKELANCGVQALATLLENKGEVSKAQAVLKLVPDTEQGFTINDLVQISSDQGLQITPLSLSIDDLTSLPVPFIAYIESSSSGLSGHYWIVNAVSSSTVELYDPQYDHYFSQTPLEFEQEWSGLALAFIEDDAEIPGEVVTLADLEASSGGCCGVPRPEDGLGSPADIPQCQDPDGPGECPQGAPQWSVNPVNMNLYTLDIPLWYTPPFGPKVQIRLSYNSQSALAHYEPVGNKWQFNYASYLVVDTSGDVTVYMPDGARDTYRINEDDEYNNPYGIFNSLTRLGENHYELSFQDGTVFEYNIPQNTSSLQSLLVSIRDGYQQSLTMNYIENGSYVQLASITDAAGKNTLFTFNAQNLIETITGPYGRSASLTYDSDKNLTSITDTGGYQTWFTYDNDVYFKSVETTKGKWLFYIEPSNGSGEDDPYPPPGGDMDENYRITITSPGLNRSEFYYSGAESRSWYVSPLNYMHVIEGGENNSTHSNKVTYDYDWALTEAKVRGVTNEAGEYTSYSYFDRTDISTGAAEGQFESVTDQTTYFETYTYNELGNITSITDPKKTVTFIYKDNNIDLQEIQNAPGTIYLDFNDAHDLTSYTDQESNTTTYSYDDKGRLETITAPESQQISYIYDATHHYVTEIQRNGVTSYSFTYDPYFRIASITDSNNYLREFEYNNLNKITKITYPDGKSESITYTDWSPHLVEQVTERSGKSTTYKYNLDRKLVEINKPGNIKHQFIRDANGNISEYVDPKGNSTEFIFNTANRLEKTVHEDDSFIDYFYYSGLLDFSQDQNGNMVSYSYEYHNVSGINYSDGLTPSVSFLYDDYFRIYQRNDGIGQYSYTYYDTSQIETVNGPWADDLFTYHYNGLGQVSQIDLENNASTIFGYDTMARLHTITKNNQVFTYDYITPTGLLLDRLTRPSGFYTEYGYDPLLLRTTSLHHRKADDSLLSEYVYTYNDQDLIESETVNPPVAPSVPVSDLQTFTNNDLNQTTDSTSPTRSYSYDARGNLISGFTPDNYPFTSTYDMENRLSTIEYNDGQDTKSEQYYYSGDHFLARTEYYTNSVLVDERRILRIGGLAIQDRDGSNQVLSEYLWGKNLGGGIGGLLQLSQAGQQYDYLYNAYGNVMSLIDQSQNIVASYDYDVFGNLLLQSGTVTQPFQFSTKRYNPNTGLLYYGYRHYSPSLGKWTSRDPIGLRGGSNLYRFVQNDPVNWVDPEGLTVASTAGKITTGIVTGTATGVGVVGTGVATIIGTASAVLTPSTLGDGTLPPGMMNEGEECDVPTTPPDGLVENPHRPGSWGEIGPDGKFKEKWRRDEGRPNIKSGHGAQDHIHVGDRWYPIKKK